MVASYIEGKWSYFFLKKHNGKMGPSWAVSLENRRHMTHLYGMGWKNSRQENSLLRLLERRKCSYWQLQTFEKIWVVPFFGLLIISLHFNSPADFVHLVLSNFFSYSTHTHGHTHGHRHGHGHTHRGRERKSELRALSPNLPRYSPIFCQGLAFGTRISLICFLAH